MENISVDKVDFNNILTTVEILVSDVEQVLSQNEVVDRRIRDVKSGIAGKVEEDYNEYLKKRGIVC